MLSSPLAKKRSETRDGHADPPMIILSRDREQSAWASDISALLQAMDVDI
jgi:hypothetical protein